MSDYYFHNTNSIENQTTAIDININQIIESLPELVYWKDTNCVYRGCNKHTATLLKLANTVDIIGKTDYDFGWSPERIKSLQEVDFAILQKGINSVVEDIIPVGKRNKIYLTSKTPLYDISGKIIGILGISTDITERKEIESELKIAKEKTEAVNYIMTEFISNMGHILVTPFSTITGVATMLLYGYSDKYLELKPLFEELIQGCTDWEKAYSQIIKSTSISEMEIKIERFSINKELQIIGSIMEHAAKSKNLKLIIQPFELQTKDLIETDKLKFHLILLELISNAIKFTEKGQITLSVKKKNDRYNIQIDDTGIGIPADKLEYIFEQYTMLSRAQKHGSDFKGVGAGLFLAKQRAKLLDAKIFVSSEFNKGSIFTLSIPVCPIKNF